MLHTHLHARDVLRMADVMPLCIFLSVEENSHGSDVVQEFPAWEDPQVSPGIGTPITVNPLELQLLIGWGIVDRGQVGGRIERSSQSSDRHSCRLVPQHLYHAVICCFDNNEYNITLLFLQKSDIGYWKNIALLN